MNTRESVAQRIYQLCEERKISVHALSLISAVPPSTIKGILYGSSKNPGIVTIKKICDGLGIGLVQFFDCEEFLNLEQEIR